MKTEEIQVVNNNGLTETAKANGLTETAKANGQTVTTENNHVAAPTPTEEQHEVFFLK